MWTVLPDICRDHDVIWLVEPDGTHHTWDNQILNNFSLLARAPRVGAWVHLRRLPRWISDLPLNSREAFRFFCKHGGRVKEIGDNGLIHVLLGKKADRKLGGFMNSVHVEAEILQVKRVTAKRPNKRMRCSSKH